MALLIASMAGASAWLYTAKVMSWQEIVRDKENLSTEDYAIKAPLEGFYRPYSSVAQSPDVQRGRFRSVEETTDERGARIFLVQYSNNARVVQYHDPRTQL